ncbi:MAG: N-6 DNA methylase, partial [Verrucomicrobiota bacterium]
MGAVYERFLAHKLLREGGRIVIEDTDELRKKEGIYYTPQYIVDYIIQHTLGEKIKPILAEARALLGYRNFKGAIAKIRELQNIKVLDPAMGSGSFLLRAFDTLVAAYDDYNADCRRIKRERNGQGALFDANFVLAEEVLDAPLHVLTENIFGVDLDRQAVEVAKLSLWLRYMAVNRDPFLDRLHSKQHRGGQPLKLLPNLTKNLKRGNSLIADKDVAEDAAFDWAAEFPELMKRGGFDVIISNPPYERIQTMQANAPKSVDFLKANYRTASSGNFDIYVCFIERGLQLLNSEGQLGFICPHKFFQAEYGEHARKLLSESQHVKHIVSFGDQQIFPKISTYTCLLFLAKSGCETVDYAEAALEHFATTHETLPSFKISASILSPAPWNFLPTETVGWMKKASAGGKLLGELAKEVFVGLQTSADDVFLFECVAPRQNVCKVFSESLRQEVELEVSLLKPVIRSGHIGRGWAQLTHHVLFPYKLAKGDAELLSEKELAKKFPLAWDYLKKNEKELRAREHGKFSEKGWWQLYPKNLQCWENPKILAPYMVQELSAYYDEGSSYFVNVTTGGFGLRFGSPMMDKYVTGLLNSRLLDAFLKHISTNFRGGYFAANKQFLAKLPIKQIDPTSKREVKLEREIVERVDAIQNAHRDRMKLPEVLRLKIAHTEDRSACNLAHYLQEDFAGAVKAEILIDDVQRAGFVHDIGVESNAGEIMLSATVAESPDGEARPAPVLRMAFQDDALREFVYACWREFLAGHSRQKKWTKGKKPEAIYPLLVNSLEPLVYFSPAASDNLRAVRDL